MKTPKIKQFIERSNERMAVQLAVTRIKSLHSVLGVMKLCGDLSFRQFAEEISRLENRWPPYQKSTVHNWTRRRDHRRYVKMPVEHRAALATLITEWAREQTGAALVISVEMNSPLRCRVWLRCANCNARFPLDLRRTNYLTCHKCAKEMK